MAEKREQVGIIKALYRYPVKSMRGESVESATVHWHGLDGDRRYAFVRGDVRSSFPWLTGRQIAEMLRYVPQFTDPADVVNSPVEVLTPNGRSLPIKSPELLAELAEAYGAEVRLINETRFQCGVAMAQAKGGGEHEAVHALATAESFEADAEVFAKQLYDARHRQVHGRRRVGHATVLR